MQWVKFAAVISGMVLLLSTLTMTNTFADDLRNPIYVEKRMPVSLTFEMDRCRNDLTCGAEFLVGETVNFSGILTRDDGRPIPNAPITVYKFLPTPELVPIATGVTGIDGAYDLTWTAAFTPRERAHTDVTQKFLKETVVFLAQYNGDAAHRSARTDKLTATISANEIFTFVNAQKRVYSPGESALIVLAFIDSNDEFVDPDRIRVVFNDQEVQVERRAEGSYTIVTPVLTLDHHQVFVLPQKEGYNINNGFLTVQVSGFFGKV